MPTNYFKSLIVQTATVFPPTLHIRDVDSKSSQTWTLWIPLWKTTNKGKKMMSTLGEKCDVFFVWRFWREKENKGVEHRVQKQTSVPLLFKWLSKKKKKKLRKEMPLLKSSKQTVTGMLYVALSSRKLLFLLNHDWRVPPCTRKKGNIEPWFQDPKTAISRWLWK